VEVPKPIGQHCPFSFKMQAERKGTFITGLQEEGKEFLTASREKKMRV